MSRYDEDLYDNPFFLALQKQCQTLFEAASSNRWIVCIPRFGVVTKDHVATDVFEDHILVPTSVNEERYQTYSKHEASIQQGFIVLQSGVSVGKKVEILFEETFYNKKDESYRVLCTKDFLNKDIAASSDVAEEVVVDKPPTTYEECMTILWGHQGSSKTRETLDKQLVSFCLAYEKFEGESLSSLVDLVSTQQTRAMQVVLKDPHIRRAAKFSDVYMANVTIAVEMYLMNSTFKHLFSTITACVKSADAEINKMTRNLTDIRLHHLGVRKVFAENIPLARKELSKLNKFSTPLGRLFCLKKVVSALTKQLNSSSEELLMTTDDFLPLLIYLIIKSPIPNWTANLMYMKHFHQAKIIEDNEFSFYLATTEAALDYIASGKVTTDKVIAPAQRIQQSKPEDGAGLPNFAARQVSGGGTSTKDKFFQYVQYGDEAAVHLMIQRPSSGNDDLLAQLCHPLCMCSRCSELVANNKHNSSTVSLYSRDDMGRTVLHVASMHGQANLIDVLIKAGGLVDATDYLGSTPLHLACQKGFQNVILLLVHFGADISTVDNEGNTPLHMCAANGHEDCVKAILFLDILKSRLNVNAMNDMGDTPLHLAAKWGYEGIVRFLLDTEADPRIRNRKRQTPLSLAQNSVIKRQLQLAFDDPPPTITRRRTQSPDGFEVLDIRPPKPPIAMVDNSSSDMMSPTTPMVASLDQADIRQRERLFKAIANDDIQLVKFYLGWASSGDEFEDDVASPGSPTALGSLCHPLCQCATCRPIQKHTSGSGLTVNSQNKKGFSPLHIAVIEHHMDIFELFLKKGANVNIKTHKNITPLHLACFHSNIKMVKMLVEAGARVNVRDQHGEIPLHLACAKQHTNVVSYLTMHGSLMNVPNVDGNTPLHQAANTGNVDVVRILLDAHAETDVVNRHNISPYNLTKNVEVQQLLLEASTGERETGTAHHTAPSADSHRPLQHQSDKFKGEGGIGTVTAISQADVARLQQLGTDITSFDRANSLKRSETFDRSAPMLHKLKHSLSIQHFNPETLKHVESVDRSRPLYLYSLSRSTSCYTSYHDNTSKTIPAGNTSTCDNSIAGEHRGISNSSGEQVETECDSENLTIDSGVSIVTDVEANCDSAGVHVHDTQSNTDTDTPTREHMTAGSHVVVDSAVIQGSCNVQGIKDVGNVGDSIVEQHVDRSCTEHCEHAGVGNTEHVCCEHGSDDRSIGSDNSAECDDGKTAEQQHNARDSTNETNHSLLHPT